MNGRIDLSEAEAVMDLIQSKNEFAMSTSLKAVRGCVRKEDHRDSKTDHSQCGVY